MYVMSGVFGGDLALHFYWIGELGCASLGESVCVDVDSGSLAWWGCGVSSVLGFQG